MLVYFRFYIFHNSHEAEVGREKEMLTYISCIHHPLTFSVAAIIYSKGNPAMSVLQHCKSASTLSCMTVAISRWPTVLLVNGTCRLVHA